MLGQTRKYSNIFMDIGASPRGFAMSNAVNASVEDLTASYYNPAGLSRITNDFQVGFMHSGYFGGILNYDYGGVAIKLKENSAIGVSMLRLGADNIPNTYGLVDQNGLVNYNKIKEFSVADYGFLVSYANAFSPHRSKQMIRYGGSIKVIHRQVGSFATAWGFGLDAGAMYELSPKTTFSAMARDITTTFNAWSMSFTDEEKEVLLRTGNDIPKSSVEITNPKLLLNAAHRIDFSEKVSLLGEAGLEFTTDGKRNVLISAKPISIDPRIGLEAAYDKLVYLRMGIGNIQRYTNDDPDQKKNIGYEPTVGVGLRLKIVAIDYSYSNLFDQTVGLNSHTISIRVDIDKKGKTSSSSKKKKK